MLLISVLNMTISTFTVLSGVQQQPHPPLETHTDIQPDIPRDDVIAKTILTADDINKLAKAPTVVIDKLITDAKEVRSEVKSVVKSEAAPVDPVKVDPVKTEPQQNNQENKLDPSEHDVKKDVKASMLTLKPGLTERNLVEKVQIRHQLSSDDDVAIVTEGYNLQNDKKIVKKDVEVVSDGNANIPVTGGKPVDNINDSVIKKDILEKTKSSKDEKLDVETSEKELKPRTTRLKVLEGNKTVKNGREILSN